MAATIFLSGLLFMQFTNHQVGYVQLDLPGEHFEITLDDNEPFQTKSSKLNIGPLMQGMHRFQIQDKIKGGIHINLASVIGGDTLYIKPRFIEEQLNPQIIIQTKPIDAILMIDGQIVDKNLKEYLNITPGKHEILVRRQGYEPLEISLQMQSGQNYNLHFDLKKH
jgi:hypothetical protein